MKISKKYLVFIILEAVFLSLYFILSYLESNSHCSILNSVNGMFCSWIVIFIIFSSLGLAVILPVVYLIDFFINILIRRDKLRKS